MQVWAQDLSLSEKDDRTFYTHIVSTGNLFISLHQKPHEDRADIGKKLCQMENIVT